jgi:ketosteroid isomerase-like protein
MSNVKIVKDAYDCFGRGDIPALLGMMTPDIEWREAEGNPYQPSGQPWKGPNAILDNLLVKVGADFEGTFVVHPKVFHDAGDTVVVEGRYTGTYKATGKKLNAQVCHVFKVRDGKLASFQQYVDTSHLQDVMGTRQR